MSNESETTDRPGVYGLSQAERRQLAWALLQRSHRSADADEAFKRSYPNAPQDMIHTAVHHVYVDGPDAVIDWLADAELFLRDPQHRLCSGVSSHLLHHVYNWLQFQALLPAGKSGMIDLLDDIKLFVEEGSLDAAKESVDRLKEMLDGNLKSPDFDAT